MLKKLICFILVACIVYTAVPAHAYYISQMESCLKQYIQDELPKTIQREYPGCNILQLNEIEAHVARFNDRCAVIVDISSSLDDSRIISTIADNIAYETYMILRKLGLTERTRQKLNLMLIAIPITKNENGEWIFYDTSVIYWDGQWQKIKRYNGKETYYALYLDRDYKKIPGDNFLKD